MILTTLLSIVVLTATPLEKLQALPTSPVPIASWPRGPEDGLLDPVTAKEFARVTRCSNMFLYWFDDATIQQMIYEDAEFIVINLSPFHNMFEGRNWTKEEGTKVDARDVRYINELNRRVHRLLDVLPGRKFMVFLDYEMGQYGWDKEHPANIERLKSVVAVMRRLGGPVWFYNYGSHYSLLNGNVKTNSPVSMTVNSDFISTSLYYNPLSHGNWDRTNQTRDKYPGRLYAPTVSLGCQWGLFEHKWKRWWCFDCAPQLGETFNLGRQLTRVVEVVYLWPAAFKPEVPQFVDHFASFVKGLQDGR